MESTVFGIPILTGIIFLGVTLAVIAILFIWGVTYTSSEYEANEK